MPQTINTNNLNVLCLPFIMILVLFSGCASHNPHIYDGEKLPMSELSQISTDDKETSIEWINDTNIVTYPQLWNSEFTSTLYLKPDRYNIHVKSTNIPTIFHKGYYSEYIFDLNTTKNHNYLIKHKVEAPNAKVWIVDVNESKQVGEIIAFNNPDNPLKPYETNASLDFKSFAYKEREKYPHEEHNSIGQGILGAIILESIFGINSWLASEWPQEYGGALSVLSLLALPDDGRSTPEERWTAFVALESIAVYNISIDPDEKSKRNIFIGNMIAWNLVLAAGLTVSAYLFKEDADKNSIAILPISDDGAELLYSYRF